jgi:hypothetical protein
MFKMVAFFVREIDILKQCLNPLNVSHRVSSKNILKPMWDVGKVLQISQEVLEMRQLSLQAQDMTVRRKM